MPKIIVSLSLLALAFPNLALSATDISDVGSSSRLEVLEQRHGRIVASTAYAMGQSLESQKDFERALEQYEIALQHDPDYFPSHLRKASTLFQLERVQEGVAVLEKAKDRESDSAELHGLLALGYLKTQRYNQAQELTQQALKLTTTDSSQDAGYFLRMGDLLSRLLLDLDRPSPVEMAKKLLPIYERAASLDEFNPAVQFRVAEIASNANQHAKALEYYQTTYKLAPSFPSVREKLAVLLIVAQKEKEAARILEEIVSEQPDKKSIYPILGQLYDRTGQLQLAEDYYTLALKLLDPNAEDYLRLALVQIRNQKFQEASAILQEALHIFPAEPKIPFIRALALRSAKRLQEAVESFGLAEQLAVGDEEFLDSVFYLEWGSTHEQMGDFSTAETLLKKSIQLNPKNHMALNYLSYMWIERNQNLPQAEKYILQALQLNPDNAAYQDTLGWLYYRKGNHAEAKRWIEKALASSPDDPTINEHMGDISLKLGQPQKALEYWSKALQGHPMPHLVEKKISQTQLKQQKP